MTDMALHQPQNEVKFDCSVIQNCLVLHLYCSSTFTYVQQLSIVQFRYSRERH